MTKEKLAAQRADCRRLLRELRDQMKSDSVCKVEIRFHLWSLNEAGTQYFDNYRMAAKFARQNIETLERFSLEVEVKTPDENLATELIGFRQSWYYAIDLEAGG